MASIFPPAPEPKSALGYYRQLAPSAGLKVSPLCLGGMSFGTAWGGVLGSCDKKATFEILDYFKSKWGTVLLVLLVFIKLTQVNSGGNFIDTASNYQNEESEMWIGEWMAERNCRDEMVIATKFTTGYRSYESHQGKDVIQANFGGMNTKALKHSLEASLKKLKTDYIDILYIHWWDYSTSIPELMHALNDHVKAGKILYLGISDTPAWIVSKANEYARGQGLRPFVVYQGRWSAADRDFERDIIPMCRAEGMGLAPWGALGGGNFKTKEQFKSEDRRKFAPQSEKQEKLSAVLEGIANKRGTKLTSVALAYVMHKTPYVFPIVGCRKISYLKDNIEALGLKLTDEAIDEIEDAVPFDIGFPMNFAAGGKKLRDREIGPGDVGLNAMYGRFDWVSRHQANSTRSAQQVVAPSRVCVMQARTAGIATLL